MLTYPWKCTVLHCNYLESTWKPLVLMTRHFDYCPSASEGDNQSVRSSAPVVSRCFPGGYNVKLYISRGRLAMVVTGFFAQCTTVFTKKNIVLLHQCLCQFANHLTWHKLVTLELPLLQHTHLTSRCVQSFSDNKGIWLSNINRCFKYSISWMTKKLDQTLIH